MPTLIDMRPPFGTAMNCVAPWFLLHSPRYNFPLDPTLTGCPSPVHETGVTYGRNSVCKSPSITGALNRLPQGLIGVRHDAGDVVPKARVHLRINVQEGVFVVLARDPQLGDVVTLPEGKRGIKRQVG